MSTNRVPGCASSTASEAPGPRTAIWLRPARRLLPPKLASPSSMYTKAVENGRDRACEPSALRQLDIEDEAGSPELDRRALPDQDPDDRIAVLPDGHLARLEKLRGRFGGLTAALVGFGGDNAEVVAAVLVYRFLTIVPTLVLGLVAF